MVASVAMNDGRWSLVIRTPLRIPHAVPKLIATYKTGNPALAISRGIDRDRAVDETGNQLAVLGRRGARPFNRDELHQLYLRKGQLYTVTDVPPGPASESTDTQRKSEPKFPFSFEDLLLQIQERQ